MTSIPSHPNPGTHDTPQTPSDVSLRSQAAGLLRFGSADGAIAQASVALDEQQRGAQQRERRARALRHEQAMERVAQLRDAAKKQRAGGIVAALGQVVQGALSAVAGGQVGAGGKAQAQTAAMAVQAGTQVAHGLLSGQAERTRTDAEAHDVLAQAHGDEAAAHEATASDARAARDRAQGHLDAVARARTQARLAVLRG